MAASVGDLRDEALLRAVVLPLVSVSYDAWEVIGTGFVVHLFGEREALILTAAHNFGAFLAKDRSNPTTPPEFRIPPPQIQHVDDHTPSFMAFRDGRHDLAGVVSVCLHVGWDLAVVRARLPPMSLCRFTQCLALDTTPLIPSTSISVLGYARMSVEQPRDDRAEFNLPLVRRDGDVLEVDPDDPRKGPIARISRPIDSAMSGGPVFEFRGAQPCVRAIARSDMSMTADMLAGSGERALATMLWPLLVFPIPPVGKAAEVGSSAEPHLASLVASGAIKDFGNGADHVVSIDGNPEWVPRP